MAQSELPLHSASALANLIESKEVSPVEAVEAYLDRIDDLDFKFNSFLTVLHERALEEARHAEQEILSGNYRGPMHGIPVGVKDQILDQRASAPPAAPASPPTSCPTTTPRLMCQAEGRRRHPAGQDQPQRVRHHRHDPPLQHPAQSLGPEHLRWRLQRRVRVRPPPPSSASRR